MMSLSPMTRMEHTAGQRATGLVGRPGEGGDLPSLRPPKGDTERTTACCAGGPKQRWYLQPGKTFSKRTLSGLYQVSWHED